MYMDEKNLIIKSKSAMDITCELKNLEDKLNDLQGELKQALREVDINLNLKIHALESDVKSIEYNMQHQLEQTCRHTAMLQDQLYSVRRALKIVILSGAAITVTLAAICLGLLFS